MGLAYALLLPLGLVLALGFKETGRWWLRAHIALQASPAVKQMAVRYCFTRSLLNTVTLVTTLLQAHATADGLVVNPVGCADWSLPDIFGRPDHRDICPHCPHGTPESWHYWSDYFGPAGQSHRPDQPALVFRYACMCLG